MKWIRTVVTVVIMIVSVGVITLGINNLTQESVTSKEVEFFIDYNGPTSEYTPLSTFDDILEYGVLDTNNIFINITAAYLDNVIIPNFGLHLDGDIIFDGDIPIELASGNIDFYIENDGSWHNNEGDIDQDYTMKLVFEVPQPPILSGTIAIILGLVPLIVASGVLYFMLRKNNLGD